MKEKGIVLSIKNERTIVSPILSEACSSCSGGCEKNHTVFELENPLHLELTPGTKVLFEVSASQTGLQGILALFIPFICSIIGFFIAGPFMNLFGITAGDGIRALFVLGFLFLSSLVVFIVSRTRNSAKYGRILELIS